MKGNVKTAFIAVFASIISVGLLWSFDLLPAKKIKIIDETTSAKRFVANSISNENLSVDFTFAAEKTMSTVVHIKSSIMVKDNVYEMDPFGDLFGDDFYEYFFGPQNRGKGESKPRVQYGTGSGVIIKSDGHIVTNNHVIDGAEEIEVTLHDNRSFKAKVIGRDPSTDLALIKIDCDSLQSIGFANSDNVKVGEWVLAVGNPFNLNSTVTAGIVSAKARNINILKDKYAIESFIQTDAAINPGNSGGALVNLEGDLIGINSAIASPTGAYSGYGFAVPSNIVQKVIGDLIDFGVVQRGFLGVMITDVNSTLVNEKKLKVQEGVLITSIIENGAGEKAGLKTDDVITSINGVIVKTSPELQDLVSRHKPGDKIKVEINRNGEKKVMDVVLTNKNGNTDITSKENLEILTLLGVDISTLTNEEAKKMKISGGVKITEINSGIIRNKTDIKEGFVVTKIDKSSVKSREEFIDILKDKKGGVMLEGVYPDAPGVYYYAFGMD